jgi:hypothetical protein
MPKLMISRITLTNKRKNNNGRGSRKRKGEEKEAAYICFLRREI